MIQTTFIEKMSIKLNKLFKCSHCNNQRLKGHENFCPDCGYELDWNNLQKDGEMEIEKWIRR